MSPKKTQQLFVCAECGEEYTTWNGRCTTCGAWSSLKELKLPSVVGRASSMATHSDTPQLVSLDQQTIEQQPSRFVVGLSEVDRVLGGGFFPGTVALFSGEPGIGKSTLLLSLAYTLSEKLAVIYISGEESPGQIVERADRLGLVPSKVRLANLTDLESLLLLLQKEQPGFVIIDSIQTLADNRYPSAPGSLVQVRECALALQRWAKATGTTLLLVGHVTKEGVVAGPRTLEHLVDVVVTIEGERTSDLRLVRTQKNRFGPTDEVGILAMTSQGLVPVDNPSARFLGDRDQSPTGSVVTVMMEGQRPILVEIQALTRPMVGAYPRRTASGIDASRLELLTAVLEARGGLRLNSLDVYVNVSGGLRLREPAVDIAVVLAIASAVKGTVISRQLAAYGEIDLGGAIRPVSFSDRRRAEAKRLGFDQILTAKTLREALADLSLASPRKETE